MAKRATGIEVGPRAAVFLSGHVKGNTFAITQYSFQPLVAADSAAAWAALEPGFAPKRARVGVTGKDVNLRYTRVPRLPDWQLEKLMRFEVAEVGDTSGGAVAADYNVLPELPEIEGEDVVLLAMVRESALEGPLAAVAAAGGNLESFSPNSIGLYNAWLRFGVVLDDTVLLAHVGYDSTDVVLVRGADLVFARNLGGGTQLFEAAIAERMGLSAPKAAQALERLVDLTPGARLEAGEAEKASRAALSAAGQLLGLLQSVTMFARTQVKLSTLKLDRVFLSGHGAGVRGVERYLSSALSVPVERFDPFRVVDTSGLDAESAAELEQHRSESVVALGLATAGSDPEAYAIDVLPAALERRREFLGGTLFLIAAGVLALGYLVFDFTNQRNAATRYRSDASRLEAEVAQRSRTHGRTQDLLRQNREISEKVEELRSLAGNGEQLARLVEGLDGTLPENFWLTSLVARRAAESSLGLARGAEAPVVFAEGRAREGVRERSAVFQEFTTALAGDLDGLSLVHTLSPDGARFTLAVSGFSPPPVAAVAVEGEAGR